jgi:hypothetical protein
MIKKNVHIIYFSLKYLYLEGNELTKLPKKFFVTYQNLKWLDLRNNKLVELPLDGLETHQNLRYLLLENNRIKYLPFEISNLSNLTALNLTDNPLEYPPIDIVRKGCKSVQDFMRDDYLRSKTNSREISTLTSTTSTFTNNNNNNINQRNHAQIENDDDYLDDEFDVWASDNEENDTKSKSRPKSSFSSMNQTPIQNDYFSRYIKIDISFYFFNALFIFVLFALLAVL